MRKGLRTATVVGLAALAVIPAAAQNRQPSQDAAVDRRLEKARTAAAADADVLVLRGLRADRRRGQVEVLAESTGLNGGAAVEFLVIGARSSHGYEALLWSYARPADVHKALEFAGLRAGAPFDPEALRMLAKGDRVRIGLRAGDGAPVPLERFVRDTRFRETLDEEGFVFGGSAPTDEGAYAADVRDPHCVVSLFNTPETVLDVPRRAGQSDVYQSHVVNADRLLPTNRLVTLVFERAADLGRVRELTLDVRTGNGADPDDTPVYAFVDADGARDRVGDGLSGVMQRFKAMDEAGEVPYVTLRLGPGVPLSAARKTAAALRLIDGGGAAVIEPPPEGQLYYRAFLPESQWRRREDRLQQPWELHLFRKDGALAGRMVRHEADWSGGHSDPAFTTVAYTVADGGELRARLDAYRPPEQEKYWYGALNVLLVFAPPRLPHGELLAFLKPVLDTHGTVYVFLESPPAPEPGAAAVDPRSGE